MLLLGKTTTTTTTFGLHLFDDLSLPTVSAAATLMQLLSIAVFMSQSPQPAVGLKCHQCHDERLSRYGPLKRCAREPEKRETKECPPSFGHDVACSTIQRRFVGTAEVRYIYRCDKPWRDQNEFEQLDEHFVRGTLCYEDGCNEMAPTWWTDDTFMECYQCSNVERYAARYGGLCRPNSSYVLVPTQCAIKMEKMCATIMIRHLGFIYRCMDMNATERELVSMYPNAFSVRLCDAFGCNYVTGDADYVLSEKDEKEGEEGVEPPTSHGNGTATQSPSALCSAGSLPCALSLTITCSASARVVLPNVILVTIFPLFTAALQQLCYS